MALQVMMICMPVIVMSQNEFSNWPKGSSPREVGDLVSKHFVEVPHPNSNGRAGYPKTIIYPEVCTWLGALRYANVIGNKQLLRQLEKRYLPLFGEERYLQPLPDHVDHTVFGSIPLQLYAQTGKEIYYYVGKWYADAQWTLPLNDEKKDEHQKLLDQGLSWQTRFWIDDMFMITAIQTQAYSALKDVKYINRAAVEMVAYLDKLQCPNGLFYHAPDVPFFWGRGNGWVATGMAEALKFLPKDNPNREKILSGYHKMMASLLQYQKSDGLWGQLVDDKTTWSETSGSAMFTYAMIMGVKNGWLKQSLYAPAARKAWLALVKHINAKGEIDSVCEGTNKKNDHQYYLDRKTFLGDMHGQAPVLWCATALLAK